MEYDRRSQQIETIIMWLLITHKMKERVHLPQPPLRLFLSFFLSFVVDNVGRLPVECSQTV